MNIEHKQFKSYDKVLIRSNSGNKWVPAIYGYWNEEAKRHVLVGSYSKPDENVISYRHNEHLVGTTQDPDREVTMTEGELVVFHEFGYSKNTKLEDYGIGTFNGVKVNDLGVSYAIIKTKDGIRHASSFIKYADFNPNDIRGTEKRVLLVLSGKVIKPKSYE